MQQICLCASSNAAYALGFWPELEPRRTLQQRLFGVRLHCKGEGRQVPIAGTTYKKIGTLRNTSIEATFSYAWWVLPCYVRPDGYCHHWPAEALGSWSTPTAFGTLKCSYRYIVSSISKHARKHQFCGHSSRKWFQPASYLASQLSDCSTLLAPIWRASLLLERYYVV